MRCMAVGATGHLFRIAKPVVLAVIAFLVGFHGQGENSVALHHLFIAMTLHAGYGWNCRVLSGIFRSRGFISWRPWQSLQDGESWLPAISALPCDD